MFITQQLEKRKGVKIIYDIPCQAKKKSTIKIKTHDKMKLMHEYADITLTLLDQRLDEFFAVVVFDLKEIYQKQMKNNTWIRDYWTWYAFHEKINNTRNHRGEFARMLEQNIQLFVDVVPKERILEGWKRKLDPILEDIKKTAKHAHQTIKLINESTPIEDVTVPSC